MPSAPSWSSVVALVVLTWARAAALVPAQPVRRFPARDHLSKPPTTVFGAADDGQNDSLRTFLARLRRDEDIDISETIDLIETIYDYSPVPFSVGDVENEAGTNEGSAKILSFARMSDLDQDVTLKCFGGAYRDVLADPGGESHANIRGLVEFGLDAVSFPAGYALTPRR